jgi:hypothetical protein
MTAPVLKWKLHSLLAQEGVTVYALNRRLTEARLSVSRTTLYRLANEQPERIDLEVAGRVLWGLEQLTGKRYAVSDLLDYATTPAQSDPSKARGIVDEEQELLEGGAADLAAALDELESDLPLAERESWLTAFEEAAR